MIDQLRKAEKQRMEGLRYQMAACVAEAAGQPARAAEFEAANNTFSATADRMMSNVPACPIIAGEIRAEHDAAQSEQAERQESRRRPREWVVTVPKSSGRTVLYGRYRQRQEAEGVAAALRNAGCAASVSRGPRGTP